MKKTGSLILALFLMLSLCACGSGGSRDADKTPASGSDLAAPIQADSPSSLETPPAAASPTDLAPTREDGWSAELVFDEPVVILDNDYVTVTATAKAAEYDIFHNQRLGYKLSIENKTDCYIDLTPVDCTVDGCMMDPEDGPYLDNTVAAPGDKAGRTMYFLPGYTTGAELETMEDLHDLDGLIQLSFSDDGDAYGEFCTYPFANVLP